MRGTFVRKLALTLASLISVTLLVGPIPAGANETEEQSKRLEPLVDCLTENPSSWLLLVDTSKSLQTTDPDDARVEALKFAVEVLAAFGEEQDVYIEILEFGGTVRRPEAMDDLGEEHWPSLDESNKSKVVQVVSGLADSDWDLHTDYLRALQPVHPDNKEGVAGDEIGVIDLFEEQRRDTCQVLLWFSDGKLSLEKGYESNGLPESFTVSNDDERGEYEDKLLDELCLGRGPVDDLRGAGKAEFGTRNSTYMITVGLGNEKDFGVLEAIAERNTSRLLATHHGEGSVKTSCGRAPGLGVFFSSDDVYQLGPALLNALSGRDTDLPVKGKSRSFYVSKAITYFMMVITTGPDVAVTLRGPGSEFPLETTTQRPLGEDGNISINADQPRSITIAANRPTGSDASWVGEWKVEFSTEDPSNEISLNPVGKLRPLLVDEFVEEGAKPLLTFELNPADALMKGKSLTGEQLEDRNLEVNLYVRVKQEGMSGWMKLDQVPLSDPTITPRRQYEGGDPLQSNRPLACEVKLDATYTYASDVDPIRLSGGDYKPCDGVGGVPKGELSVGDKATSPRPCDPGKPVPLPGYFDASSSDNEYTVEICFKAGETGAGRVEFLGLEDGQFANIDVDVDPKIHDFKDGDPGKVFTVTFKANNADLRQLGKEKYPFELIVKFKSTSQRDDASEDHAIPVLGAVENGTEIVRDWTEIILWTLGSFLLPWLLLYAYNFFWGSRFTKTGPLQRADVDVVVRNGQLFPAQGRSSIVSAEDFGVSGGVRSRTRKFQITDREIGAVAELTGRTPKLPHNEPWAEGRFQDGLSRFVLSEQGTSKNLTAGRLTPSAAPAWLLGISVADGETSSLSEDWDGRLLVVLPSEPGKPPEESFEELLPQINGALEEHNEAVHEWRNSTNVASDDPLAEESFGADPIFPPETGIPEMPDDEFSDRTNFPEIPE